MKLTNDIYLAGLRVRLGIVMPPRDSIENLFFSKLDLLRHVGEAIM